MTALRFEIFRTDARARLPTKAHPTDVGWDIHAFLLTESGRPNKAAVGPALTRAIPTGLIVRPPPGYFVQVCSRSGLAKRGIFVSNAPGIIDPDYTGELIVLLHNSGYESYYVEHENRIAQLILSPIAQQVGIVEVKEKPRSSGRGDAGFGSSGI